MPVPDFQLRQRIDQEAVTFWYQSESGKRIGEDFARGNVTQEVPIQGSGRILARDVSLLGESILRSRIGFKNCD